MKEILEKFGISEFFSYICPGAIILTSLLLWIKPNFKTNIWEHDLLVTFFILIFAYTLGLILSSYNRTAEIRYLLSSQRLQKGLLQTVLMYAMRLFWRFSSRPPDRYFTEYNLQILEGLERLGVTSDLQNITTSWERLKIFRTLIIDRSSDDNKVIENEADNFQRKSLFAMGVSIALFLLAIQAIFRLIIFDIFNIFKTANNFSGIIPDIGTVILLAISVLGIIASLELRQVAFRLLNIELYLTTCMRYSSDERQ